MNKERLDELFSYNPDTGMLTRDKSVKGAPIGEAGTRCSTKTGEWMSIFIDGKRYKVARIIWMIVYGKFPDNEIDHINGNPFDNRLCNLRDVTRTVNARNIKRRADNTSGVAGVCYDKSRNKWMVLTSNKYVGRYTDWFDAVCARKSIEHKLGYTGRIS